MTFKTSELISNANGRGGFSRRAHFQIDVNLPGQLAAKYNAKDLTFSAVSTNIPRIGVDTTANRRTSTSPLEWFPHGFNFSDLSITFLSDGEGQVLSVFRDWIDIIFPTSGIGQTDNYKVAYKAEYAVAMTIRHYDPSGKVIVTYKFEEVWPESVGEVPLNWGSYDDIIVLPVEFKYKGYTQTKTPFSSTNTLAGGIQPDKRTGLPVTPIINY